MMIAGLFDEFLGVPLHPLAVHAPVVLVPIGALAAVVLTVRPTWRQRVGWWLPATVFMLAGSLFVAKESGEAAVAAKNVFGNIDEHSELAETTFILSLVWFALALGLAMWEWQSRRRAPQALSAAGAAVGRDPVAIGFAVAMSVAAIATAIWLVRTGHAGAESRWVL
jgi:preprotein translocase subunit SecG